MKNYVSTVGILFCFVFLASSTIYSGTAESIVEKGDIVNVYYYRWDDPERTDLKENSRLQIYIGPADAIPQNYQQAFPDMIGVVTGFWQGALGMAVGEVKDFDVPPELAYNDGKTLYFRLEILEIVYHPSQPSLSDFALPAFISIVFAGVVILGVIVGVTALGIYYMRDRALSNTQPTNVKRSEILDKRTSQLEELSKALEPSRAKPVSVNEVKKPTSPKRRTKRR